MNPHFSEFARRMLSHDSVGEVTAAACAASAANVLKRLQARLAPLIGSAGMRALFARAVRLTGREFDMLSPLPAAVLDENVPAAEALAESLSRLDAVAAQAVATALYKNFLELTCSLIGEHLVLLVLQRAFPNIDVIAKQESE